MDPLLLEVLRFGTAILAGGLVAVIAQRLAFEYARRLHRDDAERRNGNLRRALVAEVRENVRRLGGVQVTQIPGAEVVRFAWDNARGIPLDDDIFDALAVAYTHAAELERYADFILGRVMYGGVALPGLPEDKARREVQALALERAHATHTAFVNALKLLEEPGG